MDQTELLHEIVTVAAGHGGRPDLHEAIDALSGPQSEPDATAKADAPKETSGGKAKS